MSDSTLFIMATMIGGLIIGYIIDKTLPPMNQHARRMNAVRSGKVETEIEDLKKRVLQLEETLGRTVENAPQSQQTPRVLERLKDRGHSPDRR